MPFTPASILWDENSPPDTEGAGLGNERIQSIKTSARAALDVEHVWPSVGGEAGTHRYGSARPFYGTQSMVSSSGSDGRLMLTSDTSRLFGVGSGGTVLLGAPGIMSIASVVIGLAAANGGLSVPQRAYFAVEWSRVTSDAAGVANVTFPNSGFSGVPFVIAQSSETETSTQTIATIAVITGRTATSVDIRTVSAASNVSTPYRYVDVLSLGTRTL
jgi:hypothetical protein